MTISAARTVCLSKPRGQRPAPAQWLPGSLRVAHFSSLRASLTALRCNNINTFCSEPKFVQNLEAPGPAPGCTATCFRAERGGQGPAVSCGSQLLRFTCSPAGLQVASGGSRPVRTLLFVSPSPCGGRSFVPIWGGLGTCARGWAARVAGGGGGHLERLESHRCPHSPQPACQWGRLSKPLAVSMTAEPGNLSFAQQGLQGSHGFKDYRGLPSAEIASRRACWNAETAAFRRKHRDASSQTR